MQNNDDDLNDIIESGEVEMRTFIAVCIILICGLSSTYVSAAELETFVSMTGRSDGVVGRICTTDMETNLIGDATSSDTATTMLASGPTTCGITSTGGPVATYGGTARASFGSIGVETHASIADFVTFTASGSANSSARIEDPFTIMGVPGGSGFFGVTYVFDGELHGEIPSNANAVAGISIWSDFNGNGALNDADEQIFQEVLQLSGLAPPFVDTLPFDESLFFLFPFENGAGTIDIRLESLVQCGFCSTVESSFFNTLTLLGGTILDEDMNPVLGATLITESGFNYLVPIPAAVWLFGAGLIGLFGIRTTFNTRA